MPSSRPSKALADSGFGQALLYAYRMATRGKAGAAGYGSESGAAAPDLGTRAHRIDRCDDPTGNVPSPRNPHTAEGAWESVLHREAQTAQRLWRRESNLPLDPGFPLTGLRWDHKLTTIPPTHRLQTGSCECRPVKHPSLADRGRGRGLVRLSHKHEGRGRATPGSPHATVPVRGC
jgi:hypothetical protein